MKQPHIYQLAKAPAALRQSIKRQAQACALSYRTNEFAYVPNPSYIYPTYELYPLAPKLQSRLSGLAGVVMDMDGTTTTTETFCVHSLEYMTRKISGKDSVHEWSGFDQHADYPHIMGNSTTKHVEYLIDKYGSWARLDKLNSAYWHALLWTIAKGQDAKRIQESWDTTRYLQIPAKEITRAVQRLHRRNNSDFNTSLARESRTLSRRFVGHLNLKRETLIRLGIDIYYQRYHEILALIAAGRGASLRELAGGHSLINPMPGVGVFIALVKGWLGAEAEHLYSALAKHLVTQDVRSVPRKKVLHQKKSLRSLGMYFVTHPVRVAVVTSSIAYEGKIVLGEVYRVLQQEVSTWPISQRRKKMIQEKFEDFRNVYDTVVTATDSSEIRLKPHRDLYSIALHQMGIGPERFKQVIGFEDSESGITAIRAAGIHAAVAVPFSLTQGHDLSAASAILPGGLPEALLVHQAFLSPRVYQP